MAKELVKGSGGGKGGGGGEVRVAREAPNTLRSTQYARILDLLCEGEIEGLVDGARSIYLDGTPLQASNGELNFKGFKYYERTGSAHTVQNPIPGFSDVETTENVGVKVTQATPVVHNILGPADLAVVTVAIPRLTKQDKSTGDLNGYYVDFKISAKSDQDVGYTNLGVYSWFKPSYSITTVSGQEQVLHINSNVNVVEFTLQWNPPTTVNNNNFFSLWEGDIESSPETITALWADFDIYYKKQSDSTYTFFKTLTIDASSETKYFGAFDRSTTFNPTTRRITINGLASTTYDIKVVLSNASGSYTPSYSLDTDNFWGTFYNYGGYTQDLANKGTLSLSNPWVAGINNTLRIQGKTTSAYKKSYTIQLTPGNSWDIKVTRISPDNDNDASINDDLYFDTVTKILTTKLSYPYSALVALQIDASQFNRIPSRAYDVKLLKVQVPSNYNPKTRTYSGVWNGTFSAPVWTDNPAWCFRDLIVNDRYGLGDFIGAANIDDWKLYEIAKYCDELVPTPDGGVEPRLTLNVYIQTKEEAFKVLTTLASVFRGILYWNDNKLSFSYEHPQASSAIFNNTNVIDGVFNYSGVSQKVKHNAIHVMWNDPNRQYKPAVEIVEDTLDIASNGLRIKEVTAVGCTSRGQAHRLGKLILLAEKVETDTITFKVSVENMGVIPGDVIEVYDKYKANVRFSGRITGATSTSIDLDQSVTLQSGTAYYLRILTPTPQTETLGDDPSNTKEIPLPTIEERLITNTGTVSTVTFDTPLITLPKNLAVWAIYENNVQPQYFKVLNITEADELTYEITALRYYNNKYTISDSLKDLQATNFSYNDGIHGIISNITATEELYFSGPVIKNRVTISWDASVISSVKNFVVEYSKDNSEWQLVGKTKLTSIEIPDATPGNYTFRVYVESITGATTEPEVSSVITIAGKTAPPSDVQNFQYQIDAKTGQMILTWDPIPDIDLKEYIVKLDDWTTGTEVGRVNGTKLILDSSRFGAGSTYLIKAVDTSGNESLNYASIYYGMDVGGPPIPPFFSSIEDKYVKLSWSKVFTGFEISHFELKYGGSDWNSATDIATLDSTDYKVLLDWQGDRTFRLKTVDTAGFYSNEATLTVTNAVPNNPTWNSPIFKDDNILLSWNAPGDSDIKEYEIREGTSWGSATLLAKTTDTTYIIAGRQATTIDLLIKAIDISGQYSTNADSLSISITGPNTPIITSTTDENKLVLDWSTTKTQFSLKEYELRYGSISDTWNTATVVGTFNTTNYTEKVTWGTSRKYFIKAYDIYGNESGVGEVQFDITYPALTGIYTKVVDNNVLFYWTNVANTLPIDYVELRKGNDFNTATVVGTKAGTFTSVFEERGGTYTYWLQPIDTAGNRGVEQSISVLVNEPPDYVLKADWNSDFFGDFYQVIVNDRLGFQNGMEPSEIIDWTDNSGGSDSVTADTDYYSGTQAGLFTSNQTSPASTGTTGSIGLEIPSNIALHRFANTTVVVSVRAKQPATNASSQFAIAYSTNDVGDSGWQYFTPTTSWQEFTFEYTVPAPSAGGTDWIGIWGDTSGSGKGVLIDELSIYVKGYSGFSSRQTSTFLLGPVNDQETWAEHFTSHSWNTPTDQISASYPYYIEPAQGTGYYEEIFDYGANISVSTKVSLTVTGQVLTGSPTIDYELWFSTDGVTFDRQTLATQTIQSNFRYVKVKINISSSGGDDLYKITNINLKLDLKLKSDAGTGTVTSTGGTFVPFNVSFLDVESITVTPKYQAGTSVIAIYDFTDVPNPTGFTVYLYDSTTGNELSSGDFSWSVRGF